jgi:ubiquinone/menaquinone biosynthesis C-methylase UbiE
MIVGKRVLELGAGWGRLSAVLSLHAERFVATDINDEMLAALRVTCPDVVVDRADARNLENVNDSEFDVVIFGFNGIDSIPYDDRELVISEVGRVLIAGGIFIHSTHNLAHARAASHAPITWWNLASVRSLARRFLNRRRLKKLESVSAMYALVNDKSLENGLLNVYIDPAVHHEHLQRAGFEVIDVIERSGISISTDRTPRDQWYYLVARKSGGGS